MRFVVKFRESGATPDQTEEIEAESIHDVEGKLRELIESQGRKLRRNAPILSISIKEPQP